MPKPQIPEPDRLVMSVSLNVLNHLGLRLYSNVPAVLSEAVANAWDADATEVSVQINKDKINGDSIIISDNGHGMDRDDVQGKYLNVGYERREDKTEDRKSTPKFKRSVMGRKGIGKLSLLSIAETVEVHTKKEFGDSTALRMKRSDMRTAVKGDDKYEPEDLTPSVNVEFDHGTKIILSGLKKTINTAEKNLRQRLARRFTVIRPSSNFSVIVNGTPISIEDRNYFSKLEYAWWYGDENGNSDRVTAAVNVKTERQENRKLKVQVDDEEYEGTEFECSGWIGTAKNSGKALEEDGESLNKLSLVVRGKVAHENLMDLLGETGFYSSYLIGEIEADFLDFDDDEDIAMSNRQQIDEKDPRFVALRSALRKELKHVQVRWNEWRQEDGIQKAIEITCISKWVDNLGPDSRKSAGRIFGLIHKVTEGNPKQRVELYKQSIVAFETLQSRNRLSQLDKIAENNIEDVLGVLRELDDLEATKYYMLVKDRVSKIEHLRELHKSKALEAEVQKYLFENHWLIDPSWEGATDDAVLEREIGNLNENELDKLLTLRKEEIKQRVDIKFRLVGRKHIVVELKKPDIGLRQSQIVEQSERYIQAVRKVLEENGCGDDELELVFLVGVPVKGWDDKDKQSRDRRYLAELGVTVYYYLELVDLAYRQNTEYLEAHQTYSRVSKMLDQIDDEYGQDVEIPEVVVPNGDRLSVKS